MNTMEPIFLDPYLTHNVWGGDRLVKDFGYKDIGKDIGECWGYQGINPENVQLEIQKIRE